MPSDIYTVIAPALIGRCRLIKLRSGEEGKVALEPNWNSTANYLPDNSEIAKHISSGKNYGIMPINNTVVFDCDTEEMYNAIPDEWKATLTCLTGRGQHLFFDCLDSPEKTKIPLSDPTKIDPKTGKPPLQIGDIRSSGSTFYTVGAGSIHPDTKKPYTWANANAPLITVKWADILTNVVQKFSAQPPMKTSIPVSKSPSGIGGSLSAKLGLRIEDFAMPVKAKKLPNGDIQGAHPIHGSTTGMNFAINPAKGVWHCYRCDSGGDALAWIAYAHCGVPEAECNSLSVQQFRDVKKWLRKNGYKEKLDALDDEFHAPGPDAPKVDLTNLLQKKKQPSHKKDSPSDPNDEEVKETWEKERLELEQQKEEAENRCLLPPFPELEPGIFREYVELGKRVSYSLEEFHFAALLAFASMALRRKILIQVGMSKVYPNVYTMVIGHTTISGKSVACSIAANAFEKSIVYEESVVKFNSTNMLRGTISEPALVQGLSETFNSLWYYDDCGGFFDDIPAWNAKIVQTLCSIYDGEPQERTLSKSKKSKSEDQYKWSCPAPFVSLLFNMTTTDVERVASNRMLSSGFFPRIMWFLGQGGQPRKNEKVSMEDKKILASIGYRIKSLRGALAKIPVDGITFEVCDIIEEWKLNATMNRLSKEDEGYRTAVSRGFIHAYKIAAILSMYDYGFQESVLNLDEYPVEVAIPDNHAKMAIKIVEEYLIPRMMAVYDMCNGSDIKNHRNIVMTALTNLGGHAERSKLLRKTSLDRVDLDRAISTLIESGSIKLMKATKPGSCKPTITIIKL